MTRPLVPSRTSPTLGMLVIASDLLRDVMVWTRVPVIAIFA